MTKRVVVTKRAATTFLFLFFERHYIIIGISLYRARVGGFHDRAAQLLVFKLAFISASEIWPFLVLYLEGSRGINVALILFILLNNNQASNDLHT